MTSILNVFASTLVLWRVLAVCIPAGLAGGWIAYEVGHREGQLAERVEVAKAATKNAQEWMRWLEAQQKKDAAFDEAMRDVIASNIEAQREIDAEILKQAHAELESAREPDPTPSAAVVVPADRDCLSPSFLRALRQLR